MSWQDSSCHPQSAGDRQGKLLQIAFLQSLRSNVKNLFEEREFLLVSLIIRWFKSKWLTSEKDRQELHQMLANELNWRCDDRTLLATSQVLSSKSPAIEFFSFSLPGASIPCSNNNETLRFVEDPDASIAVLCTHDLLYKVFICYILSFLSVSFQCRCRCLTKKKMEDEH